MQVRAGGILFDVQSAIIQSVRCLWLWMMDHLFARLCNVQRRKIISLRGYPILQGNVIG